MRLGLVLGVWECLWGRVSAVGRGGGTPPALEAIPCPSPRPPQRTALSSSVQIKTNNLIVNMLLGVMEKGLPMAEVLHDQLRRNHDVPALVTTTTLPPAKAGKGDKPKKGADAPDPEAEKIWALSKSDKFNTVIYGMPVF